MNQNEFDAEIRAKLEAVEFPYDAESWFAFEKKLDSSVEKSAADFDESVRNVLKKVETPYDSGLWTLMSRQLDRSAAVRKIRFFKLAEAAVILLLAMQTEAYSPLDSVPVQPSNSLPPAKTPADTPMASAANGTRLNATFHTNASAYVNPEMLAPNPDSYPSAESLMPEVKRAPVSNLPLIATLRPALPDFQRPKPSFYAQNTDIKIHQNSPGWFICTFAEAGAVSVRGTASASFASPVPGFGIIVGKNSGNWGFETGIQFNRISFAPDSRTTIYAGNPQTGFLASYTKSADATAITLPLRASKKIAGSGSFEIRALAGIAAELVTEKSFSKRSVYIPPANQSTGGNQIPNGTIPDKAQSGLFEQGRLRENLSAHATLGLRLTADLGAAYSIFLEPGASMNLAGSWGPFQEKIDRFSVRAGVYSRF